jgi:type IV pilus assembly protein PilF
MMGSSVAIGRSMLVWIVLLLSLFAGLQGCQTTTSVSSSPVSNAGGEGPAVEPDAAKRASIRLKLAATYYQSRQFTVAIEEANRALSLDPSMAAAYGLLGLIHMDLGENPQAEASFQRALRLEVDNPEILNNYGWFLCRTGRERLSIEQFQRAAALRRYSTPGMALQNAGLCLLQIGDTDEAEKMLRKSFEVDAGNPITQYHLTRLYLRVGRLDRAGFYYDILQRSVDANAEVIYLGVRLARANGDLRTERSLSDDLARRFPNSTEAERVQRGQLYE